MAATTLAPWLTLLMMYHAGASAPLTVPLSGQAPPAAGLVGTIGDMPPPSAALTVHSATPAGVRPALFISAHSVCSSTVVPGAVEVPPRER